jgi:hypothetical protein
MKLCIIHTGLHKTGSSSLQNFLHENAARLLRAGILYPKAGRFQGRKPAIQHQFLVRSVTRDPSNTQGDLPRIELERELAGTPHETLFVSAEFISFQMFGVDDFGLPQYFRDLGYDVKLVTYVRPQAETVVSKYTQRIKNMRAGESFAEFVGTVLPSKMHRYQKMREALRERGLNGVFLPYNDALKREGIELNFLREALALEGRLDPVAREALIGELGARVPPRRNESTGTVELALCRAISREINANGVVPLAETQVLYNVVTSVLARTWRFRDEKYQMLDAGLIDRAEALHGEENRSFAMAEWGRPWDEVFGTPRPGPANDIEAVPTAAALKSFERLLPKVRRQVLRRLDRRRSDLAGERAAE